jgi:hypothetical protein
MINEHESSGGPGLTNSWTTTNVGVKKKDAQAPFQINEKLLEKRSPAPRIGDSGPRHSQKRHRPLAGKHGAEANANEQEGGDPAGSANTSRDSKKQKVSPTLAPTGKQALLLQQQQDASNYTATHKHAWQNERQNKNLQQMSGFKSKFGRAEG